MDIKTVENYLILSIKKKKKKDYLAFSMNYLVGFLTIFSKMLFLIHTKY